jgi:outer membrane protein TolC
MSTGTLVAQTNLSFEEALAKTLANNHNIRLALVDEEIAENSADRAANGYLPTLNASGGFDWSYFEGNQRLITNDRTFDPNNSYSYQAAASVNYVLFDGLGRKYRYQNAVGAHQLSEIELKGIMETTALELATTYYEVARLQQQNASLDSTLRVSQQRLLRAEYAAEYGQSTGLDILNAQVDLNTDSINLRTGIQLEENTRRSLNMIMGEPINTSYTVLNEVQLGTISTAEMAVEATLANGNAITRARQIKSNTELALGTVRSEWYPALGLNAGYTYRGTDDPNGAFLLGSNNFGPTAGVSLSWSIFDGTRKTREANAKLSAESGAIQLDQVEQQSKALALNAHGEYSNALAIMQMSEATVRTAQDNFDRSRESYKSGLITSVEFRQAQVNLLAAELQLSQAKFTAKNAELQLLALMGQLIAD